MEEELDSDIIKATQSSLGKFVKRPPLTEKLLKKPPFRFLHDVIVTVLRTTGFFEGLFTEEELISENVKDRESKIQFLNKVITVLCLTTEQTLTVKPSKIVAGQEPSKTNELLQCLGQALEKKLSSDEAVKKYQESNKTTKSDKKNTASVKITKKNRVSSDKNEKIVSSEKDSKTVYKSQQKEIINKKESSPKKINSTTNVKKTIIKTPHEKKSFLSSEKTNQVKKSNSNQNHELNNAEKKDKAIDLVSNEINENIVPEIKNEEEHLLLQKEDQIDILDADFTSSTKIDLGHTLKDEKTSQNDNTVNQKTNDNTDKEETDRENKIRDTKAYDNTAKEEPDNENKIRDTKTLSDNQNDEVKVEGVPSTVPFNSNSVSMGEKRPQSVRPSSSRPGAPRVKDKYDPALLGSDNPIVHKVNIIAENSVPEEEEEGNIIIVDNQADLLSTSQNEEQMQLSLNQHGHLVQQILDSQKEFSQISGKTEIEWQFGAQKARDVMNQEIEQIRFNVQALSRISNPLGKLIDHIQEDVEVMRQELQEWTRKYEDTSKELSKQKVANAESLQPLQAKLKQLDADIEEKRDKISDLRIVVFKNYYRIEKLLSSGNVQ